MERVNLMLAREDSEFLDQLTEEIQSTTGAKVSRSEIVRAGIAGMREIHKLAPKSLQYMELGRCRSGADLTATAVLAIRMGMATDGHTHVATNGDSR